MIGRRMQKVIEFCRRHWLVLSLCAVCIGVGHLAGYWLHPRVVTRTETKEVVKWQDRIQTVTVEKPVVRYRDRVTTITKPGETIVIHDQTNTRSEGSETRTVTTGTTTEVASSTSSTSPAPEGRWSVRALTGISASSSVVVGIGADYRLLGPITVGLWGSVPISDSRNTQIGVSLGLRL